MPSPTLSHDEQSICNASFGSRGVKLPPQSPSSSSPPSSTFLHLDRPGERPNGSVFNINNNSTPSKRSLPGVPWSQQGVLENADSLATTNDSGVMKAFSAWGEETDDMDMELLTDFNDGEVDEEVRLISVVILSTFTDRTEPQMSTALSKIQSIHARKILHYKCLLERAQASTAAQLHALQAEVRILRQSSFSSSSTPVNGMSVGMDERCVCGGKRRRGYWAGYRNDDEYEEDGGEEGSKEEGTRLVKALKG